MQDWTETGLWNELISRETSGKSKLVLEVYMPIVQETLRAGVPGSPDFTLHDNQHGFRVANTASLLLRDVLGKLSDVEISLLLFASYCHDIGMTPSRDLVRRHYNYLVTGANEILSERETTLLQKWLDENWSGITPPLECEKVTATGLLLAEEINAYYSRSRHNDWSEDWVRAHLADSKVQLYAGWVDDLVVLCRSHHDGLSQLRQPRFDAKMVGSPATTLNLRYLAALLRVADVLEFAPERTPDVILQQRDVVPKSRIYWYKDHSISFHADHSSGKMLFTAETPNASIHKAVLETADMVDQELATCSTLAQEGAFKRGMIPDDLRVNYDWGWAGRLSADIRERDDSFVFIDGAFRPDTKRILSLLSGTALYGQDIAAARELLQNAIDAVKEQIAYERLGADDPTDDALSEKLSAVHRIRLRFFYDGTSHWLTCFDDGSGMTKDIIEKSLLVSGSAARSDLLALARDASNHGFLLGRTGEFGIGVLSYFMLADKMILQTRRSQEALDVDAVGWRFETEGLGAFGQLSRDARSNRGTDVALRLRSEILGADPEAWFRGLAKYLSDTLRFAPCRIELRDEVGSGGEREYKLGWTTDPLVLVKASVRDDLWHVSSTSETAPLEDRARVASEKAYAQLAKKKLLDSLSATAPLDFALPSGAASGRVWLGYFGLNGNASTVYVDVTEDRTICSADPALGIILPGGKYESWQGLLVTQAAYSWEGAFSETDYRMGRRVSINRTAFVDAEHSEAERARTAALSRCWREFLAMNRNSDFHELNVARSRLSINEKARLITRVPKWSVRVGGAEQKRWIKVPFPVYDLARISFYEWDKQLFSDHAGSPINEVGWINCTGLQYYFQRLYGGGELVHYELNGHSGGIVGLRWRHKRALVPLDGSVAAAAATFPPEWAHVAVAFTPRRAIYNGDHPIVGLVSSRQLPEPRSAVGDVAEDLREALTSPQEAASFILTYLRKGHKFWTYLRENHRSTLRTLLTSTEITTERQLAAIYANELFSKNGELDVGKVAFGDGQAEIIHLVDTSPEFSLKKLSNSDDR